jgi:hypothetical protein
LPAKKLQTALFCFRKTKIFAGNFQGNDLISLHKTAFRLFYSGSTSPKINTVDVYPLAYAVLPDALHLLNPLRKGYKTTLIK